MTDKHEHAEVWQQAVPSALEVVKEEEQEERKEASRRRTPEQVRVES